MPPTSLPPSAFPGPLRAAQLPGTLIQRPPPPSDLLTRREDPNKAPPRATSRRHEPARSVAWGVGALLAAYEGSSGRPLGLPVLTETYVVVVTKKAQVNKYFVHFSIQTTNFSELQVNPFSGGREEPDRETREQMEVQAGTVHTIKGTRERTAVGSHRVLAEGKVSELCMYHSSLSIGYEVDDQRCARMYSSL